MKLKLIIALLSLSFFTPVKAKPIKLISDFKLLIQKGERVPFNCPRVLMRFKEDGFHTVIKKKIV